MVRPFGKPEVAGRHTVFYEVRDALGSAGCPVCRLSLDSVAHSLDSLAYEQVNDLGLRDRLRASRGFCPHHAWQLVHQPSSGLGVALIYRDVLSEVVRILEEGSPGGLLAGYRRRPDLPRRLMPQASCPTCAILAESENRYLNTLVDHLDEPDFADIYLSSGGLCLPHLERALSYRPNSQTARALLSTAVGSVRSALEPSGGRREDRGSTLTELLVGSRGALTRRDVSIASIGIGEMEAAEGLLAGLEGEECPVCIAVREVDNRVLGRCAEGYQESYPRLCNLHAWQLWDSGEAVVSAALLDMEGRAALGRLTTAVPATYEKGRPSGNGMEVANGAPAEPRPCAVEGERADVEAGWARALARTIERPSVQAAFRGSPGLCLHHLIQVLRYTDSVGGRILAHLQAERIRALVGELDEYIRKQDYRLRGEPMGQEGTAPRRAAQLIVGPEGMRGIGGLWWSARRR